MVRREENSVGETDWEREPLGQEGRRQEPGRRYRLGVRSGSHHFTDKYLITDLISITDFNSLVFLWSD